MYAESALWGPHFTLLYSGANSSTRTPVDGLGEKRHENLETDASII